MLEMLNIESLSMTMNADEAVARGAALQESAIKSSPRFKVLPYDIHEAQPYAVKISWEDNAVASGLWPLEWKWTPLQMKQLRRIL